MAENLPRTSHEPHPSRNLHRAAWLLAVFTFPLIFLGGLVTTKQAGMAVPDWPNSFGYNMFALPWHYWEGGVLWEHSHRLLGSLVGFLAIVLVVVAYLTEPRRWVRRLSLAILAAVIVQGVLGGLRVLLINVDLAIVHGIFAQCFFCLVGFMCMVTSRWWATAGQQTTGRVASPTWLLRLGALAVAAIFAQLVIAAAMRHYEAGLAIPDFPLTYGGVLPPTTFDEADRLSLAHITLQGARVFSPTQMWLAFTHRVGAVVVTVVLLLLVREVFRRHFHAGGGGLLVPALLLPVLLVIQITLGILAVLLRKPADITTAHVAVGALTFLTTFVLYVRSLRIYSNEPGPVVARETRSGPVGMAAA